MCHYVIGAACDYDVMAHCVTGMHELAMSLGQRFSGLRGFTLVERVVVISVIALLIATLIPAVKKAKEAARIVQCASNVRPFSIGLHSQAPENLGYGPAYLHDGSDCPSRSWSSPINWTVRLYGGKDTNGQWPPGLIRVEIPDHRKLNP